MSDCFNELRLKSEMAKLEVLMGPEARMIDGCKQVYEVLKQVEVCLKDLQEDIELINMRWDCKKQCCANANCNCACHDD